MMTEQAKRYEFLDLRIAWENKIPLHNGYRIEENGYGELLLLDKWGAFVSEDGDLVEILEVGEKAVKCRAICPGKFNLSIEDSETILGIPEISTEDVRRPLVDNMLAYLNRRSPKRRGER